MLARVMRELKPLSLAVVGAEVDGDPSYDLSETGAADAVKATARTAGAKTKRAARGAPVPVSRRSRARSRACWLPPRTWRSPAMTS